MSPPVSEKQEMLDLEKSTSHVEGNRIIEIDSFRVVGLTDDDVAFYTNYSAERRKKTFRKVDIRLIPMLCMLYLLSQIDRANIGNAKIEGMVTDLNMTGVQYNTVLSIFFIPYVLFEIPSNIILKRFKRPSYYIGILVTSWGIIMTCTGLVKSFGSLMVVRILLGVFEAGFFPGAIYLCSYWYMPKDLASRISFFYCASSLSGAFSGLLAAAIAQMDGVGGYEGWRWIFLLEGIVTVVVGVACFFLLIDTPALSSRWLSPDEIRMLELSMFIKQGGHLQQLEHDGGADGEGERKKINWHELKMVVTNWRIYLQAYFLMCQSALSYGTKFTLPTLTKTMGFKGASAQLMSAPPYASAAIASIVLARISDRFFWRMPFVMIPLAVVTIGNSIIISLKGQLQQHQAVAYFAVMVSTTGIYPIQPAAASWNANNIAPESRRAVAIALNNAVGNLGGIVGSFMFISSESPKYYTGFGLSLAFGVSGIIVAGLLEISYKYANAKKAKVADEARVKYSEQELFDMGDRSPLFKHVL